MNGWQPEINRLASILKGSQSADGSWRYCVRNGVITDSYMIILLRTLRIHDEPLIRKLARRIISQQTENGSWKVFEDEPDGNLSSTVEAYYALLYSGYYKPSDPRIQAAKSFILSKGGLHAASLLTKVILAATGQYPWPRHIYVPLEIVLLPLSFPLNFFDFVGYTRVHMAPVLVLADRRFSRKTKKSPDLSDLYPPSIAGLIDYRQAWTEEMKQWWKNFEKEMKQLPYLPKHIHQMALKRIEKFMLQRIEPDGTLYSYATSTILMIYALLALGYSSRHPVILQAIKGMKKLICTTDGSYHLQNFTSTVWNTALLSHSLQRAGLQPSSPMIAKAGRYLLSRQHDRYGDWVIKNQDTLPGGWGFSDINTINPDIDDTTAALRAIHSLTADNAMYYRSWNRGLNWVLSMQNQDGGWPAFEKNTDKEILRWIPIEGADSISIDPSSADLTGRTLEFLGNYAGKTIQQPNIEKAVKWMLENQEKDGSWYGRWGICYIYGTWSALTGLSAVGLSHRHPSIAKAVRWLEKIQNPDGGWGESCLSDVRRTYVPLGASTLSQTAWAVDALISVHKHPTPAIEAGIRYLLKNGTKQNWTTEYPTGGGLPGQFYIQYESYRYIWPLLALGNYKSKFL